MTRPELLDMARTSADFVLDGAMDLEGALENIRTTVQDEGLDHMEDTAVAAFYAQLNAAR